MEIKPDMSRDSKWYCLEELETSPQNRTMAKVRVPADSAWFSGHFPGNPVLPGIAQLFLVLAVIEKATGRTLELQRLYRTKYRRIIRPEEIICIHAFPVNPDVEQWSFELTVEEQIACRGRLQGRFIE